MRQKAPAGRRPSWLRPCTVSIIDTLCGIYKRVLESAMPKRETTPSITINIRLPSELAAKLRRLAAAEQRSLNGQIVHLLQRAVGPEEPRPAAD
jgi:hypothetical protein